MPFIIKTQCKEARSGAKGNPIMTQEGDWAWVCEEPDGWVEATASSAEFYKDPPKDVLKFTTEELAIKFIKRWKGHPWYYVPNGTYEIIEVVPKYKTVQDGWEVK